VVVISSKFIDMTNRKIGRWLVLERAENYKDGTARWLCLCECGTKKVVLGSRLRNGQSTSCGCYNRDKMISHGMKYTRPYTIWKDMKQRCNDEAKKHVYKNRNITYTDKWEEFESFWGDMQEGYADHLTLDRIDNEKGYYKENCRWATLQQQAQNRRKSITITVDGKDIIAGDFYTRNKNISKIDRTTFYRRIKNGWDPYDALTKRIRKEKS
jgi:hypothetical protein